MTKVNSVIYDNELKYDIEFMQNLEKCKSELRSLSNLTTNNNDIVSVCAPGRVNLIGEHIDYNEGFVFPMAIPLYTIITGVKNNRSDRVCRVKTLEDSLTHDNLVEFNLNDLKKLNKSWANYVIGVVALFPGQVDSFDAVIKSNVPLGSGLSSSAALEVSVFTFLENLTKEFFDCKKKSIICQKAEHEYASVPCGIMDQFISTMSIKGHALLIDCRSFESKQYPFNDPNVSILVVNSNVKHQLEGTEYSSRRKQCELVAQILGKKSLRDAGLNELNENKEKLDEESFKRGKHAITEIQRTLDAANALESNDMVKLGLLMNESHESLKNDFNVSCAELDSLVEISQSFEGVYGSRMTGGGFGGCTVTLVKTSRVKELIEEIKNKYKGIASFYVSKPCDGARKI